MSLPSIRIDLPLAALLGLAACGGSGQSLDSSNDTHCAALGYTLLLTGEEMGDPETVQKATTLYQWYVERLTDEDGQPLSPAQRRQRLLPVVQSITGDFDTYLDAIAECGNRASSEPGFAAHLKRIEQHFRH